MSIDFVMWLVESNQVVSTNNLNKLDFKTIIWQDLNLKFINVFKLLKPP